MHRIEAYIAKFQRWMKVLDGLGNRWDERRYAKKFLKGLQESVKTRVIFDSEDLTLEGAYEASRVATSRASVLGAGMAPTRSQQVTSASQQSCRFGVTTVSSSKPPIEGGDFVRRSDIMRRRGG